MGNKHVFQILSEIFGTFDEAYRDEWVKDIKDEISRFAMLQEVSDSKAAQLQVCHIQGDV